MREGVIGSLMVPGICFVCESAPQGRIVDTLQTFETPGPSPLNGRKYICEGCVRAAAEPLGLVSADVRDRAETARAIAEGKLRAVRDFFAKFTVELEAQLDHVESQAPAVVAEASREATAVAEQEEIEGVEEFVEEHISDEPEDVDAGPTPDQTEAPAPAVEDEDVSEDA